MENYTWILNLVDKVSGPMQSILAKAGKVESVFAKAKVAVAGMAVGVAVMNQVGQAVGSANAELQQMIGPGVRLNQSMADLKAITGATAEQLEQMRNSARDTSKVFGGEAAQYAEAYKGILSELGPEIAKQPAALNSMGRSVAILAQTMGGDAVGAQQALTAGLQQFGGTIKTPQGQAVEMTRQMNIMAAAAQAGAAEVPQIAQSLKVAGVAAVGANVGFLETNAAIQVLAKGTIKGAEAGTALRNVMTKMQEGRFMPKEITGELKAAGVDINKLGDKSLTFQQRLNELKKVQGDSALMAKLFGLENVNAASILIKGADDIGTYKKAFVGPDGVKAALVMAADEMDSYPARMSRMGALWKDLGVSAFQALEPMLPMLTTTGQLAESGARLAPILGGFGMGLWKIAFGAKEGDKGLLGMAWSAAKAGAKFLWAGITGVGSFILSMVSATAAQLGLNVAMSANPIGAVVVGLLAVGTAVYMIIKHWDVVKTWLWDLTQTCIKLSPFYWLMKGAFAMFPGLEAWFKGLWDKVTGFLHSLLSKVKWIWDKIAPYLGFGKMNIGVPELGAGLMQTKSPLDPTGAGGLDPSAPGNGKVKSKLDKVSSGGSKPTTINITFQKFQDKIEIHNSGPLREGVNDAVAMVEEAFVRMLNGVSMGYGAE